jgi:hypothetical protein
LVKTTLSRAVMAFGCIIMLANFRAMAQDAAQPAAAAPVAGQPGPAPAPQNGAAQGNPQPAAAATDDGSLLGNGLWTDPTVGQGCPACGGGSAAPPDWYTLQGVRVISRTAPRKIPITSQAPASGTYAAIPDPTNATPPNYGVVNNVGTIFTDELGTVRQSVTGPSEVLTARQFGLGVAAGYDFTIGHYFCRDKNNNDHFMELTFWGLNSWSKDKSVGGYLVPVYQGGDLYTQAQAIQINLAELIPTSTGNFQGSLRTPFPMAGSTELPSASDEQKTLSLAFNYGTGQTFEYRSTMNNFELNDRFSPRGEPERLVLHPDGHWQRECQPGTYMSYLFGLRFMQIDETFTFQSTGVGPFGNDSTQTPQHAAGDYGIVTHNDLLGLQVGAEMMFQQCRWAWGFYGKAGPYVNFCSQQSTIDAVVTDGAARPAYHQYLSGTAYPAALIGEAGFQATYKFKPNLVGRASFDFMWVSGVALAPEQLQFAANPVSRVSASGAIFSEGVSLGLEWLW